MVYTLSNNEISIKIDSFGAELKSLVKIDTNKEYMWEGNPVYWKRTSPVLFPLVGSLKDGQYTFEGKEYPMPQHGFARDMEFEMTKCDKDEISFSLLYNEETLSKYPFCFKLEIGYKLVERAVVVMWKVTNLDDKKMYFSIGGHPAFRCPIDDKGKRSDCYLKFEDRNKITSHRIVEAGLVGEVYDEYELVDGVLPIKDDLFDKDALIIEENDISAVSLLDVEKTPYLTVKFDAPLFGVWSPVKKDVNGPAPFVCIEPWYGRCDSVEFAGVLGERQWGNELELGKIFEASYEICV